MLNVRHAMKLLRLTRSVGFDAYAYSLPVKIILSVCSALAHMRVWRLPQPSDSKMVMSLTRLGTKNHRASDDQQQFISRSAGQSVSESQFWQLQEAPCKNIWPWVPCDSEPRFIAGEGHRSKSRSHRSKQLAALLWNERLFCNNHNSGHYSVTRPVWGYFALSFLFHIAFTLTLWPYQCFTFHNLHKIDSCGLS